MAGFAVNDRTYADVEEMAYDLRTTRKNVVELMVAFVCKRKAEFTEEMF